MAPTSRAQVRQSAGWSCLQSGCDCSAAPARARGNHLDPRRTIPRTCPTAFRPPARFPPPQDPTGAYVKRWVPELAALPDKWVHEPWRAPPEALAAAGVELGRTYPHRIADRSLQVGGTWGRCCRRVCMPAGAC